MFRKLALVMLAMLLAVNIVSGQDDEITRLRVMQLSYVSQGSAVVDIQIDEAAVFEGISFPFITDYVELAAGGHTLTTTISNDPDVLASMLLMLEVGHSYSVVVEGDYREGVTFIVVDENDVSLEATGSAAILVNLTGQTITDIALDGEPVLETISVDDYGIISLPVTEFALSGRLGDRSYSETFNPHSNTLFLVAIRLLPSDDPQVIYQRSSPLTVADYLQSIGEGAQFSRIAQLISMTNLLNSIPGDGEYTLFLPINNALDGGSTSDDEQLHDLFARHIMVQALPPYLLPGNERLTTIAGSTVSLNFDSTASCYWEIEGAPILWDVRLANGVIYAVDGMID
jgi:hypothetical protein